MRQEGMKAYRGYDGKLRLFRPWLNCKRMQVSNECVGLPSVNPSELLELIVTFVSVECPRWLPDPGSSLYLRPSMVGTGSTVGIEKPSEALFFLFAALFPQKNNSGGVPPGVKLLASSPDRIRAWPGGFGYAKVIDTVSPILDPRAEWFWRSVPAMAPRCPSRLGQGKAAARQPSGCLEMMSRSRNAVGAISSSSGSRKIRTS
jgi:branched-chain amino acid aminotransferase